MNNNWAKGHKIVFMIYVCLESFEYKGVNWWQMLNFVALHYSKKLRIYFASLINHFVDVVLNHKDASKLNQLI